MIQRITLGVVCAATVACSTDTEQKTAYLFGADPVCGPVAPPSGPPPILDGSDSRIVATPATLDVNVALAEGIAPPSHGRIGLLVSMPLPYHLDPTQRLHQFEFDSSELPALPTHVSIPLDVPPANVLDNARAWARDTGPNGPIDVPVAVDAQLVIYDDVNGNEQMDIDEHARTPSHGTGSSGSGNSEFVLWHSAFGTRNEMISFDTISASYADVTGQYTLTRRAGDCDLVGDVTCCVSRIVPLTQDLVINYAR